MLSPNAEIDRKETELEPSVTPGLKEGLAPRKEVACMPLAGAENITLTTSGAFEMIRSFSESIALADIRIVERGAARSTDVDFAHDLSMQC